MPKEKNYNPVQAQRKADKARAIKKGKAEVQERRNEKLARKNPERIQKQIDDLKATASRGGKLTRHEEQVLEGLQKELKAVNKAREALGDQAPSFGRRRDGDSGPGLGVLGKRRRGSQDASSSDDDVPDDVRNIPMPRDTPPPIPKEVMDRWYAKRRARRNADKTDRDGQDDSENKARADKRETRTIESKTVYEAAPVMRDLRKEAVSSFVPAAVQVKMMKGRGQGGLMEPEEADRLEREGYLKTTSAEGGAESGTAPQAVTVEEEHEEGPHGE